MAACIYTTMMFLMMSITLLRRYSPKMAPAPKLIKRIKISIIHKIEGIYLTK